MPERNRIADADGRLAAPRDPCDEPTTLAGAPSVRAVGAAGLGLVAGWVAAGSTGLTAAMCQRAVVVGLLFAAIVLVLRRRDTPATPFGYVLGLVVGVVLAAWTWLPGGSAGGALGVAAVLGLLAWREEAFDRRAVLLAAWAVGALALWRLAAWASPAAWAVAEWLSLGFGHVAQTLSGSPPRIGPSFAGLDFLVSMGVLYVGWLRWTARPRAARAVWSLLAILGGHCVYLIVLARANDLAAMLPAALPPPPLGADDALYLPPAWRWCDVLRAALPWNVPVVAVAIQTVVAALMFRWARWTPIESASWRPSRDDLPDGWFGRLAPACVAAALAVVLGLSWCRSDLSGKTVLVFEHPDLNWSKPTPGDPRPGVVDGYGMLPSFVSSLGGLVKTSAQLSEAELNDADILLVIEPLRPWPEGTLERIEAFVRRGGSLLVAAGPISVPGATRGAVDDVLRPAGMSIRFDATQPASPGWQDALAAMACPVVLGEGPGASRFELRQGSSIAARWPARPILVGRWGHAKPGSDSLAGGETRYESGERLGDLVLAAWTPLERGKIVALADGCCLSNGVLPHNWPFVGRLLGWLASGGSGGAQDAWRQAVAAILAVALIWLVVNQGRPARLTVAAATLLVSLGAATLVSRDVAQAVPQGEPKAARPIAYIDGSHHECFSTEPWSNQGLEGLTLSLARAGYLPLVLPKMSAQRLDQAAVLISIGPAESFSPSERKRVGQFVRAGGLFVATIGATESAANESLLADFGFDVGPASEAEPVGEYDTEQFGHFRTAYLNAADYGKGDYFSHVWLFTPWPVRSDREDADTLVNGPGDVPVAVGLRVEKGAVVVVGDSGFALNHNMGYYNGEPIAAEGLVENDHFWRWMLGRMTGREEWYPPNLASPQDGGKKKEAGP